MKETSEKPKGQLGTEGLIVITALLMIILQKFSPPVERLFHEHHHFVSAFIMIGLAGLITTALVNLWNSKVERANDEAITRPEETAALLGVDLESKKSVSLKREFRTMHMQVIGTTNAGKSESTVIPLAVSDIKNGNGVFIMDGKPEGRFVDKLYAYVKKYKREKDFRFFSLADVEHSWSFNPLKGESAQLVCERVFSSFTFENEYYRNVQRKYFLGILRLVYEQKEIPTFPLVKRLFSDMAELKKWIEASTDTDLKRDMGAFSEMSQKDREEKTSGIDAIISNFVSSEIAILFEETDHQIDFDEAMEKSQILYFQLPTMLYPDLGEATGKLVLQSFQSAIAKRQLKIRGGDGTDESDVLLLHS